MIRIKPFYKRLFGLPKTIYLQWKFLDHPSAKTLDKVKFCIQTILIIMR